MSLSDTSSIASRLSALAQRLGLSGRVPRLVFERARHLQLPFQPLPVPAASLWWAAGPPLQRLVDLPRDALSGPVQEDKAAARAVLMGVVEREVLHLDDFDLRRIDGLCSPPPSLDDRLASFEELAASPLGRGVRIISYKDFLKTISQAMPRFLAAQAVEVRQASWYGERLFWAGEQQGEAFACAIAYARLRGLEVTLPAELTRYRLSASGLGELRRRYHMLAMPVQAWSEPAFMSLLLNHGLPYARLSLLRYADAPEFLLLPKNSAEANALGEGLRLAGAPDVIGYLDALHQRTTG
ncbi:hypothetical protein DMO17_13760 [Aquipseudomonas alcaligenes]|uniref:Uncharacterized protein n=1 Tax=Aquipseudomonas alcaligenes TaxID=43263 RepID=A0A2V4KWH4_AQUAC|nr:DUF6685 family protein [Pseudomonas alcaligenes]PYC22524.1 hypothetical protein DMO17_13760 [Pseudomonas alcaligenes]